MLAKKQRLNLRYAENLQLLRKSSRVHSDFFTFYYYFDKQNSSQFRTNKSQVATTVSKKIEKLDVDRIKIKRQLYSILSLIMNENNLWQKNVKIILVTKKSLRGDFEKMKTEVENLFKKSNLII